MSDIRDRLNSNKVGNSTTNMIMNVAKTKKKKKKSNQGSKMTCRRAIRNNQ